MEFTRDSDASGNPANRVEAGRSAVILEVSGEERKPLRGDGEPAIQRPDPDTAERCRDEKVNVNPSDAATSQAMSFDKLKDLAVLGGFGPRQLAEEPEDLEPSPHSSERQLAEDERVHQDEPVLEKMLEAGVPASQVVDPDGRVDERQRFALRMRGARRRRAGRRPFSEQPSTARRRALSRATRASRPAWTIAVFSFRPVSLRAFSRSSSFRISVVLICINIAYVYAFVNRFPRRAMH
jgi:hypothetical protein